VVARPLKPFENELYTLLEVQGAEIDAMNATRYQFLNHVDREPDAILLHEPIVMLVKNEVMTTRNPLRSPTLIPSRSARIEGGTEVPQSFVIRRKDA
jgi:hypothetical protein